VRDYQVIKLGKTHHTIVDRDLPSDLLWILDVSWYAHKSRNGIYARSRKYGMLHRIIAGAPPYRNGRSLQVDHDNGDHLDNRDRNLNKCYQKKNVTKMWRAKNEAAKLLGQDDS